MSEVVGRALVEAVRGPEPSDVREVVAAFGGPPAVARAMVGVPLDRRPRDMTPDVRRRYENAKRQAQRWVTRGRERRASGFEKLKPAVRRRLIESAWRAQELRRWDELGRGARTRLVGAEVSDETPSAGSKPRTRLRTLPAIGTPGKFLASSTIADLRVLALAEPPDVDEAGEVYVTAFFTQGDDYVWDFEPEIADLEELTIWPEGTAEGSW